MKNKSFISKATEEIDALGTAFAAMEVDYKELCDFFGEDVKTDPSEVLGTFVKFTESFAVCTILILLQLLYQKISNIAIERR